MRHSVSAMNLAARLPLPQKMINRVTGTQPGSERPSWGRVKYGLLGVSTVLVFLAAWFFAFNDVPGLSSFGGKATSREVIAAYTDGRLRRFPDGKMVFEHYPLWQQLFMATLQALPLLLLRRPLAGLAAGGVSVVILGLCFGWSDGEHPALLPLQLVMVVLMVTAIWRHGRIIGAGAWLFTLAALIPGMTFRWASFDSDNPVAAEQHFHTHNVASGVIYLTAVAAITALIKLSLHLRRALAATAVAREQEQARRTALEERAHLARELHDIVAHRMSLIAVQARSAPLRLAKLTEEANAEFSSIAENAGAALAEVRTMLTVLRRDGASDITNLHDAGLAPQPGAGDVEQLLESTRQAGIPVHWTIAGDLETVSAANGLTLYRLVQESLANAARHAPGKSVSVQLHVTATTATVLIRNELAAPLAAAAAGHGLTGMTERAATVGGTVSARPVDGEFVVAAELPAGPAPARA